MLFKFILLEAVVPVKFGVLLRFFCLSNTYELLRGRLVQTVSINQR